MSKITDTLLSEIRTFRSFRISGSRICLKFGIIAWAQIKAETEANANYTSYTPVKQNSFFGINANKYESLPDNSIEILVDGDLVRAFDWRSLCGLPLTADFQNRT